MEDDAVSLELVLAYLVRTALPVEAAAERTREEGPPTMEESAPAELELLGPLGVDEIPELPISSPEVPALPLNCPRSDDTLRVLASAIEEGARVGTPLPALLASEIPTELLTPPVDDSEILPADDGVSVIRVLTALD